MIDSHAHLTMFDEGELDAVVGRAREAGVTRTLVPATGAADLDRTAALVERLDGFALAALGFHPHEASALDAGWKRRLEQALDSPGVVAVGEIGLDYHYENSPREDQRPAFRWQLELARERGLPVVLHHREAWDDFLAVLDAVPGVGGVAHSFTEGAEGVVAVHARGLHVGISGMVTFPRGDNIRAAAAAAGKGSLLVETDSPYLAPVPHRGRRNEPALVRLVAEAVAGVREVSPDEIESETDEAFAALFGGGR